MAVQAGGRAHGLGHGLVVAQLPGGHRKVLGGGVSFGVFFARAQTFHCITVGPVPVEPSG